MYSLRTYERVAQLQGHNGSILALTISQDKRLLLSSAADRYVNVGCLLSPRGCQTFLTYARFGNWTV